MSQAPAEYVARLNAVRYLGIVCPLLVLDRPLSGTWVINIADPDIPLTGVIETTTYIDPSLVGGHHLVYLPKYTAPDSRWLTMTDDEVRRIWLDAIDRMFPGLECDDAPRCHGKAQIALPGCANRCHGVTRELLGSAAGAEHVLERRDSVRTGRSEGAPACRQ